MKLQDYILEDIKNIFSLADDGASVTIVDRNGVLLRVSDPTLKHLGFEREEMEGKTIDEAVSAGMFFPAVTPAVLEQKRNVSLLQKNRKGQTIMTTGIPIFDKQGEINYVLSFDTEIPKKQEANINTESVWMSPAVTIGESPAMKQVLSTVSQVAKTDATILLTGETGVGKSLIASLIHRESHRASKPFVEINCGSIPENLMESELFGYENGAFTGANTKGKPGRIEMAAEGTLFLDEIGELSNSMQTELLYVVQNKLITKVGGTKNVSVDFRLIVATNRDLNKAVREGMFRQDLYYRLNIIPINIPPLRERPEDMRPLISFFLKKFNNAYNKNICLSEKAIALLEQQPWPGNIRQVENMIERIVLLAKTDQIDTKQLSVYPDLCCDSAALDPNETFSVPNRLGTLKKAMEEYEAALFRKTYEEYKTSTEVAKAMGISQTTAYRKLKKYIPEYTGDYEYTGVLYTTCPVNVSHPSSLTGTNISA
jgi:TyrR family helix-turn-helix protein